MSELTKYMDVEKKKTSEMIVEEHKDDILIFLMEKGVSYPSELARQTSISIEGVNQLISHWKKLGFVEKIYPHPYEPQPEFKGRMHELWASGIWGYERINSYSWWTITKGGVEYLKVKYKGKGLRIKGSLMKSYGFKEEVKNETKELL